MNQTNNEIKLKEEKNKLNVQQNNDTVNNNRIRNDLNTHNN
jgi:hypothetical protein